MNLERYANPKYRFGNRNFCAAGYCVSAAGINTAAVQKHIREQEKQDRMENSLRRKECEPPFKGSRQSSRRGLNKVKAGVVQAPAVFRSSGPLVKPTFLGVVLTV